MNRYYQRRAYEEFERIQHNELVKLLARSHQYIDTLHEDHLFFLSLLAILALDAGYVCGLYSIPFDLVQDEAWRSALVLDLPNGQLSWPIPDDKRSLFRTIPLYHGQWQGFSSRMQFQMLCQTPGCKTDAQGLTVPIPAFLLPKDNLPHS